MVACQQFYISDVCSFFLYVMLDFPQMETRLKVVVRGQQCRRGKIFWAHLKYRHSEDMNGPWLLQGSSLE